MLRIRHVFGSASIYFMLLRKAVRKATETKLAVRGERKWLHTHSILWISLEPVLLI